MSNMTNKCERNDHCGYPADQHADFTINGQCVIDLPDEPETPQCPNGHGPMVRREPGTPEQAWCGAWWDCAAGPAGATCTSSYLEPSDALREQRGF